MITRLRLLLGVALLSCAGVSEAATLVGYQMDEFSGTDSLTAPAYVLPTDSADIPSSFTVTELETVALSVGSALSGVNQAGFYRFTISSAGTNNSTLSNAYIEFTVDPKTGQQFSLDATDSLQFYTRLYDTDDFSAGLFVRSSLDGYSSTLSTWLHPGSSDATTASFDLSGFTNVAQSVTFRIYYFDTDGDPDAIAIRQGGSLGTSGDLDFVLNGSVTPVPEPTALSLAGLALLVGLLLSSRRRARA